MIVSSFLFLLSSFFPGNINQINYREDATLYRKTMSFSSLLSQITSDKNIKEKLSVASRASKTVSTSSTSTKKSTQSQPPSAGGKPTAQNKTTTRPSRPLSSAPPPEDDPAVRRLKEARRKERERLEALKGKSKPNTKSSSSSSTSSKQRASSPNTPSSLRQGARSLANSTAPRREKIPPPQPIKSRFKFKPSKHVVPAPALSHSASSSGSRSTSRDAANRISFKDLMKQAESIKQPTIAVQPFNLAKKSPQKEPSKAYQSLQKVRLRGTSQSPSPSTVTGETTRRDRARPEHRQGIPPKRMVPPPPSRPVGFAKPNPDLLNKLKQRREYAPESERSMKKNSAYQSLQKKRKEKSDSYSIDVGDDDDDDLEDEYGYGYGYDDEYDSQDDGFIVDEDEEGENMAAAAKAARRQRRDYDNMRSQGYSKDEIWEIFNRGKKRSYYDRYDDYDSDDMEATGTEILEDEERTLKQAKLDDLREQKLLAQKALQKRKITKKH